MITFCRASILIVSTVLTGCAGCPVVGQVTATRLDGAWVEDKSTCDCHYLLQVPRPAEDIKGVANQTSRVTAMVHPTKLGAVHTKYTFLANMEETALRELANNAREHELMFHGCRVPDVNSENGEEFVLNVGPNPYEKFLLRTNKQASSDAGKEVIGPGGPNTQ